MNFIERIFGISPDAGSGAFELILIALPALILVALATYSRPNALPLPFQSWPWSVGWWPVRAQLGWRCLGNRKALDARYRTAHPRIRVSRGRQPQSPRAMK
jgi:hypothetical protein